MVGMEGFKPPLSGTKNRGTIIMLHPYIKNQDTFSRGLEPLITSVRGPMYHPIWLLLHVSLNLSFRMEFNHDHQPIWLRCFTLSQVTVALVRLRYRFYYYNTERYKWLKLWNRTISRGVLPAMLLMMVSLYIHNCFLINNLFHLKLVGQDSNLRRAFANGVTIRPLLPLEYPQKSHIN